MCFHCKEEAGRKSINEYVFPEINALEAHWRRDHSTSLFLFYTIDLLNCNVDKCGYYSTFQGLWKHHQNQHVGALFVAKHNDRCALCFLLGEETDSHKCPQIEQILRLRMLNPILYSEESIAELQTVNVPKRFQCLHCKDIFETGPDVQKHHQRKHRYEIPYSFNK